MPESKLNAFTVFCSYSHKDDKLRERLEVCLQSLRREGLISVWHDRRITGEQEWAGQIDEHLNRADLILLLVTPSFVASSYCMDIELTRAMERQDQGNARVIPIIFRHALWTNQQFARLQALPKDGKPVIGHPRGSDYALLEVIEGIRKMIVERDTFDTGLNKPSKFPLNHRNPFLQSFLEEDRQLLAKIISSTGVSQKDLAIQAGVNRSWFKQVMESRPKRVDRVLLGRIAERLADQVKAETAALMFPEDDGRAALALLSRLTQELKRDAKIYNPGGPVPIDAGHYVRREADDEIGRALRDFPFTMLVTGPVQCGKSSLLTRLENKATSLGIDTLSFDPVSVRSQLASAAGPDEMSKISSLALAESLKARWRLQEPSDIIPDSIPRIYQWIIRSLEPTKTRPKLLEAIS